MVYFFFLNQKKKVFFFQKNTNQYCTPPHLQEARERLGKKQLWFPFGLVIAVIVS